MRNVPDPSTHSDVAISSRIVAAGCRTAEAGDLLKLTLGLSPESPLRPDGQAWVATAALADWPRAVARALFGGEGDGAGRRPCLSVYPLAPLDEGNALPCPATAGTCAGGLALAPWRLRRGDPDAISALWRKVMPRDEGEDFAELRRGIEVLALAEGSVDRDAVRTQAVVEDGSGRIALIVQIERALTRLWDLSPGDPAEAAEQRARIALKVAEQLREALETVGGLSWPPSEPFDNNAPSEMWEDFIVNVLKLEVEKITQDLPRLAREITSAKARAARQVLRDRGAGGDRGGDAALECGKALATRPAGQAADLLRRTPGEPCMADKCAIEGFETVMESLEGLYLQYLAASEMGEREKGAVDNVDATTPFTPPSTPGLGARGETDRTEEDIEETKKNVRAAELASRRLQELQADAGLSRLFNLTVDFAVSLDDVVAAFAGAPTQTDPMGQSCRYMMLKLEDDGLVDPAAQFATYAKLTLKDGRPVCFAPVSIEEIALVLGPGNGDGDLACLTFLDGVRLLSAAGGDRPRAQLSAVNPRDAAHDLDTRMTALLDWADRSDPEKTFEHRLAGLLAATPAGQAWPAPQIKGRAIRLLDFGRRGEMACAMGRCAALIDASCETVAFDAGDLSIGLFYDLAMARPGGGPRPTPAWRPTSARRVTYSDDYGYVPDLDELIDGFFAPGERMRYDRASAALLKRDADRAGGGRDAVTDGVSLEFTGEQLGIDPAAGTRDGAVWTVGIRREGQIDITRRLEPPDPEGPDACWPLRVGYVYHVAAREISLGGGSTEDAVAQALFERPGVAAPSRSAPDPAGFDPSSSNRLLTDRSGHPFVRVEGVERPQILLDADWRTHRPGSYDRDWDPSTTADAILRSERRVDGRSELVDPPGGEERYVIVPGGIDLELLRFHNAVDEAPPVRDAKGRRRPADALAGIDLPRRRGGWPLLSHHTIRAPAGAVLDERRLERDDTPAVGSGLFRARPGGPGIHAQPYWPDPLCRAIALRLRQAGGGAWIGSAEIVPVAGERYPEIRPISLRVRPGAEGSLPTIEIVSAPCRTAGQSCTRVDVLLPLGYEVELLCWAVPDVPRLALMHEMPLMLGAFCVALKDRPAARLPNAVLECAAQVDFRGEACEIECGPAGLTAPTLAQRRAAATWLVERLREGPVPSLTAGASLNLRHAVDRPPAAEPVGAWAARRRHLGPPVDAGGAPTAPVVGLSAEPPPLPDWALSSEPQAEPGATAVELAGTIRLDPAVIEAVELLVVTPRPIDPRLDTAEGRTALQRRRNIFPMNESDGTPLKAGTLYGFQVSPGGHVTFPVSTAKLARIDRIPPQPGPTPGPAYLSVHALFAAALASADPTGAAKPEELSATLADGTRIVVDAVLAFTAARFAEIEIVAMSRTAPALRRRVRLADLDGPLPATPGNTNATRRAGVTIPASARPGAPVLARKIRQSFAPERRSSSDRDGTGGAWAAEALDVTPTTLGRIATASAQRQLGARLRFARPLFGSGEGEKLGVVLSPRPSTFAKDGRYAREWGGGTPRMRLVEPYPDPDALPAELAGMLTEFAEAGDRVPGRGPWRTGRATPYPYVPVPFQLFSDVVFSPLGVVLGLARPDVSYSADALLPIHPENDGSPARFWPVDLILYTPRFNVAEELWTVDLGLDSGPALMPYLQLGLVRWNGNAPRTLATSRIGTPGRVVVLPERRTTVRSRRMGGDRVAVTVEVLGPFETPSGDEIARGAPRMDLTLSVRQQDGAGRRGPEMPLTARSGNAMRVASVDLPASAFADGGTAWIDVEEVDHRLEGVFGTETSSLQEQAAGEGALVYQTSVPVPPPV